MSTLYNVLVENLDATKRALVDAQLFPDEWGTETDVEDMERRSAALLGGDS